MKAMFIFLLLLPGIKVSAQDYTYHVPGHIPLLKQPKDMDCWITVATLMFSWRDSATYAVSGMAVRLGDPWKLYYDTNSGLPESEQDRFIRHIGLKSEPPANYMVAAYVDFLKKYGPVWIITGNSLGAHARLLTGVDGTGELSAEFTLIDPKNGQEVKENALKFLKEFEAEAKIANAQNWERLRIQIYHF
ncbi:MAG: hypothetical protein JWR12_3001 [Mucilaginibacter sp.]|nr:hypothetical protein [Mucilaginibacter sp.]